MLLPRFRLHRPATLAEAIDLIAAHEETASPIAGGTELVVAMKARVLRYDHLVDLKRIAGLAAITRDGDAISIGALATHDAIARDPLVREHLPVHARTSAAIGNIRVRAVGTLGGNLCFAEPHADPPALLAALGATLDLVSPEGSRSVAVEDFFEGPFATVRAPSEVLTTVRVPVPAAGSSAAYANAGHLSRPAVTLAAVRTPTEAGDRWSIVAGAVSGRPVRLTMLEDALAGVPVGAIEDVLGRAAKEVAAGLEADDDLHGSADYKRHLVSVLAARTVRRAAGDTGEVSR